MPSVVITLTLGVALGAVPYLSIPYRTTHLLPSATAFLVFAYAPFTWLGVFWPPALVFWAWSPQLFRGRGDLPERSYYGMFALTGMSLLWFGFGWRSGAHFLGPEVIRLVALGNAVALGGLWWLWRLASRTCLFRHSLLFHGAVNAWLFFLAFPLLNGAAA